MVGLHTLSFLIVGHTKFSPDWCIGLIKRQFRRTNVSCLADISTVVDKSATVNIPQLVGTQEGEVLMPTYDWAGMLGPHFRKLKNIKTYHHFQFEASTPGVVQLRVTCDGQNERETLLKTESWCPTTPQSSLTSSLHEVFHLRDSRTSTTALASTAQKRRSTCFCPRPLQLPVKSYRISSALTLLSYLLYLHCTLTVCTLKTQHKSITHNTQKRHA